MHQHTIRLDPEITMKDEILLLLTLLSTMNMTVAQDIKTFIDRQGTTSFYSEVPLEDIQGTHNQVFGALNLNFGSLSVSMLVQDFNFEQSLMEEHFNEKYLESDKFPKITFKGMIIDFVSYDWSSDRSFEADVVGELEVHGVKKPLTTVVNFIVSGETIKATTEFELSVADYGVEIPTLGVKKIAEVVEVKSAFTFIKQD